MSKKDIWEAEMLLYENLYRSITGRKTKIFEIPPKEGELGYTSSDETIHLARRHPILANLKEELKQFFRMGVFAHEMCHQLFTDFAYMESVLGNITWEAERKVVMLLANLVEDPAIEYEAETAFGGDLLAALRFSIAHIYRKSPNINSCGDAFSQLCSALIQFGDEGILKGHFTYDEAYKMFCQIAPEFNEAVTNPDPKARIDAAVHFAELTRPLWEPKNLKEEEELMQQVSQLMDDNAITKTGGSEILPPTKPERSPEKESEKEERKEKLLRKLAEKKDENEEDGQGGQENSGDSFDRDDGQESSDNSSDKQDGQETDSENGNGTGQSEQESDDDGDMFGIGEAEPQKKEPVAADDDLGEFETEDNGETLYDKEVKTIDADMLKSIKQTIERSSSGIEKRRKRNDISYDYTNKKQYGSIRCLNQVMTIKKEERNVFINMYGEILKEHMKDIRLLTGSLRKIFQQDIGENVRALSGRYNVVRASKQSTAKIFDRRRNPKNLSDLAVMLLIDESGSMSFNGKIEIAKATAAILAESFANLQIPCYIMGFTTMGSKYDAVHHHYVSWKNTKDERISLAGIDANEANFDGFAIRNATEILRKKPAEHKILFVISDGYPASARYRNLQEGVKDTAEAITEAKRVATVLGIGIGDCEPNILKKMYRGSFVHAKDIETLSVVLTKNLKKILKLK